MTPNIPFAVLAALIRLGHKYELTDIMNEAAKHLEEYFTTDLDTWLDYRFAGRDGHRVPPFKFTEGERAADLFECVNLARLTGKPAMLPTILYSCCQLKLGIIVSGSRRHNGAVERLSEKDLTACAVGCTRLFKLRLSGKVVPALLGATQLLRAVPESTSGLLTNNALAGLEWSGRNHEFTVLDCWKGLCSVCRDDLKQKYRTTQQEIWDKLPSVFGFEMGELGLTWAERYTVWHEGLRSKVSGFSSLFGDSR